MDPEHFQQILQLAGGEAADDRGFRELPQKTTLTLFFARQGAQVTVTEVEAVALKGPLVHARTTKGDLYVASLSDLLAVNVEGREKPKAGRRAGFG
jgi:hypothetical protein